MPSSVEKRIARALFVFRIDRLGSVISTASASAESFIPLLTSIKSRFTRIEIIHSNCQRFIALELQAIAPYLGQDQNQQVSQDYLRIKG